MKQWAEWVLSLAFLWSGIAFTLGFTEFGFRGVGIMMLAYFTTILSNFIQDGE